MNVQRLACCKMLQHAFQGSSILFAYLTTINSTSMVGERGAGKAADDAARKAQADVSV